MSYPLLLAPAKVGGLHLRNRVVMPPMVTDLATADGQVTDRHLEFYATRAAGGVALIIIEATAIDPDGRIYPGQLGLWSDEHVAGLRRLAEAIHAGGALAAVQLHHAGRRSNFLAKQRRPMVAPSDIPHPAIGVTPQALSPEGITVLLRKFAAAAGRARQAGMDALEVHGAHGYLLNQFLSPLSNQRDDAYGGTPEKRLRFPLETVRAIRAEVGAGFPLLYRLTADEFVAGGLTPAETGPAAERLAAEGVSILHVSGGGAGPTVPSQGHDLPPGALISLAPKIKAYLDSSSPGVGVIAVGGIFSPELAEDILRCRMADLVAVGRGLLSDPDWVRKAAEGKPETIRMCSNCPKCGFRDKGCPPKKTAEGRPPAGPASPSRSTPGT